MFWKTLIFAFLIVGTFADEKFELTDERKEQLKALLTKQCKNNNAEGKVDDVTNAVHSFVDCLKGLFDVSQLEKEIEEAKPNGALDEVFKKYCAKSPQLKTCISSLFDGVSPCLDESTRGQIDTAKSGTDQLIDFICYKDGDRIALFISEQGPECFRSKANEIRTCAEKIKDSVPTVDQAKSLSLADKCGKFDELSKCIVEALEKCDTPTPGNMAESLFRYVRKGSACHTAKPLWNKEFCRGFYNFAVRTIRGSNL